MFEQKNLMWVPIERHHAQKLWSGILGQPSQTGPKDGPPLEEERDGNKAPLRKKSAM